MNIKIIIMNIITIIIISDQKMRFNRKNEI